MSDPLLPPGLTVYQNQTQGSVGYRNEIVGIPSASERIEDFLTATASNEGSLRAYTSLKVLYQGQRSSVWMCNWHSVLRPKHGTPPLIELPRFGEGTRLIALKIINYSPGPIDRLSRNKELDALRCLPPHRNIIPLYDFFFSSSSEEPKLYIALGAMEGNLYHLIKARRGRTFAGGLVSSILHQLLLGLDHLHSNGYFHRDLKPENVLITTQGLFDYLTLSRPIPNNEPPKEKDVIVIVKLCDFGLAREIASEGPYTEYVNTRWYRAPEVLLLSRQYTSAVDIWAVGAIAAEILALRPLFPGTDQINQVLTICNVLGSPAVQARFDHNGMPLDGGAWPAGIELARSVGFQFPKIVPRVFASFFQLRGNPDSLLNFIKGLLAYDPQRRPTSHSCLRHQYFFETASHRAVPAQLQKY